MKEQFFYLSEMCKAVGRIIAGIAMLNFKASFWALRISLLASLAFAGVRLAFHFQAALLFGLTLILIGAAFIVRTHRIVTQESTAKNKMIMSGPFSVARHPMYSGWSMMAIGSAMLAGRWFVTVLAILQVLFMFSVSCAEDEENAEVFGRAYRQYSDDVQLFGIFFGAVRLLARRLKKAGRTRSMQRQQCQPSVGRGVDRAR